MSMGQLLDAFAEALESGSVTIEEGKIKGEEGVAPIEINILEEQDLEKLDEMRGLHFLRLLDVMRYKGYPDRAIREKVDSMIDMIKDSGKYNSKRDSGEWGC